MKSLNLLGLIALVAATAHSQTYYASTPPDCSNAEGSATITDSSGKTLGYSCYDSGTFVWFAAGGPARSSWGSSIRVSGLETGAIKADYLFFDVDGNNLSVDTTQGSSTTIASGNEVTAALNANQPLLVNVLGATTDAPGYTTTQTGSIYATFYCPDAATCSNANPQLIYSALPSVPWSLSVPIAWDSQTWTTWYAEGIDDGGAHRVSFVIYNQGLTATAFKVYVYDDTGKLAGTGTTPTIAGFSSTTGQAGTYGALLSQVVSPLPSGVFRVVFDGGTTGEDSSVEVLQFTGTSATALNVWTDAAPGSLASADASRRGANSRLAGAPRTRRVVNAGQ